jgi:ABC-type glycerol-3-phosphate transport system substrate-binding protein
MAENTQLGKTYGLPFNKSTEVFIYNKTYFEENSLPNPNTLYDDGQWTWTKLAEIAQSIKDLNTGKTAADKFFPFSYDSSSNLFITLGRQWGGEYTNNKGKLLFDNPKTEAAVKFYQDQHTAGLFTLPTEWEALYGTDKFLAGDVFMTVGSSAGVSKNVPLNNSFQIGVAPIPQENAAHKSVIQQGTNLSIMVNSTDEQRLAAWMLIKYLTSAEVTLDLSMETGYLPVRKSVLNGTKYNEFLTTPSVTNPVAVAIAAGGLAAKKQVNDSFYDPAFNTSSNVRAEVGLAIEAALYGNKTAKQAIKAAYDELNINW